VVFPFLLQFAVCPDLQFLESHLNIGEVKKNGAKGIRPESDNGIGISLCLAKVNGC